MLFAVYMSAVSGSDNSQTERLLIKMIRLVQSDEDMLIKNLNITNDPSGPYNKIAHWIGKNAEGYVILFTNASDQEAVDKFFNNINKSLSDPKAMVTNSENLRVMVISQHEFKNMGGKFVNKEAILVPTKVTVLQYKITDNDIVVYMSNAPEVSTVIPILISYTVTYKKSLLFMGKKKAVVKIISSNCMPDTLFYKITGCKFTYPITDKMIHSSFSVDVGQNNLTVFAAGKYGAYYNVKQKKM